MDVLSVLRSLSVYLTQHQKSRKNFEKGKQNLCHKCRKYNFVGTHNVDKIGKSKKNVNQLAVLGSLHTGVGAIMATMEVPALSRRSFNDIEETVGEALETEATESCEKAAIEEISLSREQNLPDKVSLLIKVGRNGVLE